MHNTVKKMIKVKISSNESREYTEGTCVKDVIIDVHGRKSSAIAGTIDGIERDMNHSLHSDCSLRPIDICLLYTSDAADE